jgi:hypothetical protein
MPGEQEKVIAVERAGKSKMKQDFGGGFVREFAQAAPEPTMVACLPTGVTK